MPPQTLGRDGVKRCHFFGNRHIYNCIFCVWVFMFCVFFDEGGWLFCYLFSLLLSILDRRLRVGGAPNFFTNIEKWPHPLHPSKYLLELLFLHQRTPAHPHNENSMKWSADKTAACLKPSDLSHVRVLCHCKSHLGRMNNYNDPNSSPVVGCRHKKNTL